MARHAIAGINGQTHLGRFIPSTVDIETGDDIDAWGETPDGAFVSITAGDYAERPVILTVEQTTNLRDLLTRIIEGTA